MKNTYVKTFEQFKVDKNIERVDEGLFGNDNKVIAAFVEDITSGKLEKTAKLKKSLDKYNSHANRQFDAIKKRMHASIKGLSDYLANTEGDAPSDLEKLVAMAVIGDDKVGKDDKGIWKGLSKIKAHGTGGADAASWGK